MTSFSFHRDGEGVDEGREEGRERGGNHQP